MSVHFNPENNKLVIEIKLEDLSVSEQITYRKEAILELLDIVPAELLNDDVKFWSLQLIRDLEPSMEQYQTMLQVPEPTSQKKQPADWVKVDEIILEA